MSASVSQAFQSIQSVSVRFGPARRYVVARLAAAFGGIVLASLVLAVSAQAAPVENVSNTSDSGTGSLRQALVDVNPGGTINVPASTIPVTGGQLAITKSLTIQGAGASNTIVDATGSSRVFQITAVGPVAINGITIRGGAVAGSGPNLGGAGIRVASGTLTLNGTSVTANNVVATTLVNNGGGGIYNTAGADPLTLNNSSVDTNFVTTSGASSDNGGGGIYNDASGIALNNSSVDGNTFVQTGVAGSTSNGGGGIHNNTGTIGIDNSSISDNLVTLDGTTGANGGGGIYNNGGAFTVTDSSLNGNTFTQAGTVGTTNIGGGGFWAGASGVLTLTRSTVANNTATISGTATLKNGGGGFYANGGAVSVVNSTVSTNTATIAGISAQGGGGIYNNGGAASLLNVTVAANATNLIDDFGGGIYQDGGVMTVKNTIVSQNTASTGANCAGSAFGSLGNNVESANTCTFADPTDLVNTDPLLGPLADNGGPTLTRAILTGSLAIDAGDNTACPSTDQRGVSRPQPAGGTCEPGAYEYGLTAAAVVIPPAVIGTPAVPPVSAKPVCSNGLDDDQDGFIDSADPRCHTDGNASNPASYNPNGVTENPIDNPLLVCSGRQLVLIDVSPVGARVALNGVTERSHFGKTVKIATGGKTVARAKVRTDGTFATTAAAPPRRLALTARYQARLGKLRSLDLKLARRMYVQSARTSAGRVVLKGRVMGRRLAKAPNVVLYGRDRGCGALKRVGSVRLRASGRFSVTAKPFTSVDVAVYRARTTVLDARNRNRKQVTFTLPRSVRLR